MTLETSIEFLKGIGPERAKFINSVLGIRTVGDLLTFYPLRYIDKSDVKRVADLTEGLETEVQLRGKITELKEISYGLHQKRLSARFRDETGSIDLVWFRYSKWLLEQIPLNTDLFIFGRLSYFNGGFSMPHPEIETDEKKAISQTLQPLYPGSEKLAKRV